MHNVPVRLTEKLFSEKLKVVKSTTSFMNGLKFKNNRQLNG